MLWTAFTWGLGVTCGGSFGLMVFVVLFAVWKWLAETKIAKAGREIAELSLNALIKRNELTEEQIDMLERIAVACEQRTNGQ